MHDDVAAALDAAFPGRAVDAVETAGVSWNEFNRTVRVEFEDGESCYLKVADDRTRVVREAAVIRYVGANSPVPVARVLASDIGRDPPYLATAPVGGRSLALAWDEAEEDEAGDEEAGRRERERLARAQGRGLARLHELRFEEHGHVVGGDPGDLDLDVAPWTDVLVETLEELQRFPDTDDFAALFEDVIGAIESNRDRLDRAPAALLHGDVAKPNCVYTDDGSVGFVDWETAHVGDPVRDLCRAEFHGGGVWPGQDSTWVVDAVQRGYRDHAGSLPSGFEDRRPVYDAVHMLLFVTHFEKMVEHADRSYEALAAWVREEAEQRLTAL